MAMNASSAARTASATCASPELLIASCVGPAPMNARTAASTSSKTIGQSTSSSSEAVKPAAASASTSLPGSESANIPLCFMLPSASSEKSGVTGLKTAAIPDSGTRVGITTATAARDTRAASLRARTLSSANWNALNPVTTSNASSSHGNASMSPTRKSPSDVRSVAISINSSDASIPATLAPRSAAIRVKRPAPHPQSSTRVLGPISARASTCW